MLAGQVKVGFTLSVTVTVKLQVPVLFDKSEAEQLTVVVPFWKVEPEAGSQVTVRELSQLSLAVGGV
jgi:hypothetical protein